MTRLTHDAPAGQGEEPHNPLAENGQLQRSLVEILDTLPSMIARVDRDGRVDLVNRCFEQFSGYSAANARGMRIESLIPQFGAQLQRLAEAIDRATPVIVDRIQLRRGKDLESYSLQICPLGGESGGMAVIRIDDISEHVRSEAIMVQAEKMMMVGSLASGLAHEINNPLGVIMQHAQNIERRIMPEIRANQDAAAELGVSLDDVRAYLEKRGVPGFLGQIREAGGRAARIVNNIRNVCSRSEPFTAPANLGAVIDRALALAAIDSDLNTKYDFRQVEIVREYDPALPEVVVTVHEIEQVLLHIIRNAAQAMTDKRPDRAGRITLRLRREGDLALIEIEDNGPGMEQSLQRRIFEPFFTTRPVGAGTGLGLALCYAIITNNHEGSIGVDSQPGEGARFTIRLPIRGLTS